MGRSIVNICSRRSFETYHTDGAKFQPLVLCKTNFTSCDFFSVLKFQVHCTYFQLDTVSNYFHPRTDGLLGHVYIIMGVCATYNVLKATD